MTDIESTPVEADDLARWRRVPKVELHLHLDTSISFDVARRLEPTMTREQYLAEFQAPPKVGSLTNFLTRAFRQVAMLQTAEALRLLTDDVIAQLAADGVVYAELRFAPLLHTESGMSPRQAVDAVLETAHRAGIEYGVDIGFILCALRHFDEAQSMATARLVAECAADGVPVGFDLAGDEISFPLTPHLPAFEFVRERGLPFTVHAGEAGGPANVIEVLDALAPARIGHGVRAIEDDRLVERLADRGPHLETCPSCNVQTEIVEHYRDHPIAALRSAGVNVGISTDQRTITPITLSDEYALLHRYFGWIEDDFLTCNRAALAVAFTSDGVKARVDERLAAGTTRSGLGA
jgi:adenosine deaminase